MTGDMIKCGAGDLVSGDQQADPFALLFGRARPTLNAARKIQPLADAHKQKLCSTGVRMLRSNSREAAMEDRDIARKHVAEIPADSLMYKAEKLFCAAECDPAPEPWLHAAIGLIFEAIPSAKGISPSVRFGIVDSMLFDSAIWDGYRPGFSIAVVAQVALEVRRTAFKYAPLPAEFLAMCQKHRANFKELADMVDGLIALRQSAEDVLFVTGDLKEPDWKSPFGEEYPV